MSSTGIFGGLTSESSASDVEYAVRRLEWRQSLSDVDVRALAYEYRIGAIDDCTEDAWKEYQHRFGDPESGRKLKGPTVEFPKKPNASAAALRRRGKKASQRKTSGR